MTELKTITVQIGNTDDKLSQREWSDFCQVVDTSLTLRVMSVHFSAPSSGDALWQNRAWVCVVDERNLPNIRVALAMLAKKYRQDSIAFTVGDTEFLSLDTDGDK